MFQQTRGDKESRLPVLAIVVGTCKRVEGPGEVHRGAGDEQGQD